MGCSISRTVGDDEGKPYGQIRPSSRTASRSSDSSLTEASIRPRENSLISRPWTISKSPLRVVTGNEETRPSGTPYEPSETTPIEVQSPSAVPLNQVKTWSRAADAADAAEEEPRASMIAAPRLATVGMKELSSHCWSLMYSAAFLPEILALNRSGYWVAEW